MLINQFDQTKGRKPTVRNTGKRPLASQVTSLATANQHLEFAALLQKLALEQLRHAWESHRIGCDIGAESEDKVQMALMTLNGRQDY